MAILIAGLALWTLVHFIPTVVPSLKKSLCNAMGTVGYRVVFTIAIVVSVVLIVLGWRQSVPMHLYVLPAEIRHVMMLLVLFAFLFFFAARRPTNIKRFIRHPQLLGVVIWSIAHVLVNGDSRSLLLFGWLGLWAVVEMVLINRRDTWNKPAPTPWKIELIGVVVTLVLYVVVMFFHPYFTGFAVV